MSGRRILVVVIAMFVVALFLVVTMVAAMALLYSLTEADGQGAGLYAALLAGCVLFAVVLVWVWRRRRRT